MSAGKVKVELIVEEVVVVELSAEKGDTEESLKSRAREKYLGLVRAGEDANHEYLESVQVLVVDAKLCKGDEAT